MWVRVATAAVFLAYAAALVWQARVTGLTYDEPAHLAAGYMYWRGEDRLEPPDAPPLTRLVEGWVPLMLDAPLQQNTEQWSKGEQWAVGTQMLDAMGPEGARRLIFLARLPMLIFPLLLLGVAWAWVRELLGPAAALAATTMLACEPNLLAHGALIKSDVPASTGLLALAYCTWRYWRDPVQGRFWALAIVAALAIQTKFTVQAAFPLVALALLARHALHTQWKTAAVRVALLAATAYVLAAALHQFDLIRIHGPEFEHIATKETWSDAELASWAWWPPVPVPARWVEGIAFVRKHSRELGFRSYFLGEVSYGGDPLYFPVTLALKLPIPLQALVLAGLALFLWRLAKRTATAEEVFLWLSALVLFGLAMQSKINIGYRHVMPLTPLFFLGAVFSLRSLWSKRAWRIAAGAGLAWLAVEAAWIYPYGISYFNQWAGGPDNGWRYLADSNIDWGQDWPQVARYADQHGIEMVEFAYFGQDRPWHYLPGHRVHTLPTPFCGDCVDGEVFQPKPGFYAISVNLLLGYYWDEPYRDYFRYFRDREPDAKAGYSIFLYDLR
ncbi:MAG: glycosyltransferase family 39 protein [Bryobacterales bacterium]|nr:glycosyltransferase family 39 protein [Bryobacterales bacterium]